MNDQPVNPVQIAIQKIFLKDVSYETPMGVKAFQQTWKPKFNQQLQTSGNKIDDKHHEVVLTVTLTAMLDVANKEETAFIVEVKQAGIFQITAPNPAVEKQLMATACPNILFPYAREALDNLVVKGGYPPVVMPPINFDALYQQALLQQNQPPTQSAH
jgi:preprotein translocase subunit SecB